MYGFFGGGKSFSLRVEIRLWGIFFLGGGQGAVGVSPAPAPAAAPGRSPGGSGGLPAVCACGKHLSKGGVPYPPLLTGKAAP